MPYARRNDLGEIVELRRNADSGADEFIDSNDPEVMAFLGIEIPNSSPLSLLRGSDTELARVVEDLIKVLVRKHTISLTDLPLAAQGKLARREDIRQRINADLTIAGKDLL